MVLSGSTTASSKVEAAVEACCPSGASTGNAWARRGREFSAPLPPSEHAPGLTVLMDVSQKLSVEVTVAIAVEPDDISAMGLADGPDLSHGACLPGVDVDAPPADGNKRVGALQTL